MHETVTDSKMIYSKYLDCKECKDSLLYCDAHKKEVQKEMITEVVISH